MTMRRRTPARHRTRPLAVLLSVALVAVLVGCSGDDEPEAAPPTAGVVEPGDGPTYRATVHRTGNDVAHVEGAGLGDVGFGQGWAAAEDHGCTLAESVVTAAGSRSRWFGAGPAGENVDSDVTMRALGVPQRGLEAEGELGPDAAELMAGYVAGVRAWFAEADPDSACEGLSVLGELTVPDVLAVQYRLALAGDLEVLTTMATASPEPAGDAGDGERPDPGAVPTPPGGTAWAIGSERTESGGGVLLTHPLLDWEGATRLWENHLRVPGRFEVYGASFVGVPVPAVGFNADLAYSPVPSPSPRGTAHRLALVADDPTRHVVDGAPEALLAEEVTVEVRGADGELATEARTVWRSRFGPVVEPPGLEWSATSAVAWQDVALAGPPMVATLLAMAEAGDLADLRSALDGGGAPAWAATVAATADGRAWYADTASTPALAPAVEAAHAAAVAEDPSVAAAAARGIVVVDGTTATAARSEGPDGPTPAPLEGAVEVESREVVAGTGSGSWLADPARPLVEGSPARGADPRALSPSDRQSLVALREAAAGLDGDGGPVPLAAFQEALLSDEDLTGSLLADEVEDRCRATPSVTVPATDDRPEREVPLAPVCAALDGWDRAFTLESRGALLWRAFLGRFDPPALTSAGVLFEVPFREADPLGTPRSLAEPPDADADDPVMVALAQASLDLAERGIPLDAVLREVQWAQRGEERIPFHGGAPSHGAVGGVDVVPARGGVRVVGGPSYVLAVAFTDEGPVAEAVLTYGQSDDPASPGYVDQAYRYSDRAWRPVLFRDEDVLADPVLVTREVVGARPG